MAPSETPGRYRWRGWDGEGRPCGGELGADDPDQARLLLAEQGIAVADLRRRRPGRRRPGPARQALFARQLAVMVRAGLPLTEALRLLATSFPEPRLRAAADGIRRHVATGSALADALAAYPLLFDDLGRGLVAVGEQCGRLDELLERLALARERLAAVRSRVRRALLYPLVVLVVALAVVVLLLVAVIPTFEGLFAGLGADLPPLTRAVLDLSDGVRSHGPVVLLAGLLLAGAGGLLLRHHPPLAERLRDAALRPPLLGTLLHRANGARFARTLATLARAGVPLLDALETTRGTLGPPVYRRAVDAVRRDVADGRPLHQALAATGLFAPLAVQMVRVGEETGGLDALLERVAEIQEGELDTAVDTLTTLLEPVLMVVLGGLLGGLILAMYLPVFRMGEAITGGY